MIYLIFMLAVLTQFLVNPHVPGFTPVFGALLFCGARLRRRDAIWFPVAVLAVSDWLLTTQVFHMEVKWGHAITLVAFAAMARIGGLLRDHMTTSRFIGSAFVGSTAYFLISNFGVWLAWGIYPRTREGLIACYVAALPYYRTSTLSALVGGAVLFGGYEWIRRRHHDRQLEPSSAHVS